MSELKQSALDNWQRAADIIDLSRERLRRPTGIFNQKATLGDDLARQVDDLLLRDPMLGCVLGKGIKARHLRELIARFEQVLGRCAKEGKLPADFSSNDGALKICAYRILANELLSNVIHTEKAQDIKGWILPTLKHGSVIYNSLKDPEISAIPGLSEIAPGAAKRHSADLRNFLLRVAETAREVWAEPEFARFEQVAEAVFRLKIVDAEELRARLRKASSIHTSVLNSDSRFAIFRENQTLELNVLRLAVNYGDADKLSERLCNSLKKLFYYRERLEFRALSDTEILQADLDSPHHTVSYLKRKSTQSS